MPNSVEHEKSFITSGPDFFNVEFLSLSIYINSMHTLYQINMIQAPTALLSPLAECHPDDATLTFMWRHSCYDNITMTSFV